MIHSAAVYKIFFYKKKKKQKKKKKSNLIHKAVGRILPIGRIVIVYVVSLTHSVSQAGVYLFSMIQSAVAHVLPIRHTAILYVVSATQSVLASHRLL